MKKTKHTNFLTWTFLKWGHNYWDTDIAHPYTTGSQLQACDIYALLKKCYSGVKQRTIASLTLWQQLQNLPLTNIAELMIKDHPSDRPPFFHTSFWWKTTWVTDHPLFTKFFDERPPERCWDHPLFTPLFDERPPEWRWDHPLFTLLFDERPPEWCWDHPLFAPLFDERPPEWQTTLFSHCFLFSEPFPFLLPCQWNYHWGTSLFRQLTTLASLSGGISLL